MTPLEIILGSFGDFAGKDFLVETTKESQYASLAVPIFILSPLIIYGAVAKLRLQLRGLLLSTYFCILGILVLTQVDHVVKMVVKFWNGLFGIETDPTAAYVIPFWVSVCIFAVSMSASVASFILPFCFPKKLRSILDYLHNLLCEPTQDSGSQGQQNGVANPSPSTSNSSAPTSSTTTQSRPNIADDGGEEIDNSSPQASTTSNTSTLQICFVVLIIVAFVVALVLLLSAVYSSKSSNSGQAAVSSGTQTDHAGRSIDNGAVPSDGAEELTGNKEGQAGVLITDSLSDTDMQGDLVMLAQETEKDPVKAGEDSKIPKDSEGLKEDLAHDNGQGSTYNNGWKIVTLDRTDPSALSKYYLINKLKYVVEGKVYELKLPQDLARNSLWKKVAVLLDLNPSTILDDYKQQEDEEQSYRLFEKIRQIGYKGKFHWNAFIDGLKETGGLDRIIADLVSMLDCNSISRTVDEAVTEGRLYRMTCDKDGTHLEPIKVLAPHWRSVAKTFQISISEHKDIAEQCATKVLEHLHDSGYKGELGWWGVLDVLRDAGAQAGSVRSKLVQALNSALIE